MATLSWPRLYCLAVTKEDALPRPAKVVTNGNKSTFEVLRVGRESDKGRSQVVNSSARRISATLRVANGGVATNRGGVSAAFTSAEIEHPPRAVEGGAAACHGGPSGYCMRRPGVFPMLSPPPAAAVSRTCSGAASVGGSASERNRDSARV